MLAVGLLEVVTVYWMTLNHRPVTILREGGLVKMRHLRSKVLMMSVSQQEVAVAIQQLLVRVSPRGSRGRWAWAWGAWTRMTWVFSGFQW